eukprot:EG_transcript_14119
MDGTRKLRLWEMEHSQSRRERPSSAERERRIAKLQREKFDREERIRHINYPFQPHYEGRSTRSYVSESLLEPTFSSQAKSKSGQSFTSPKRRTGYSENYYNLPPPPPPPPARGPTESPRRESPSRVQRAEQSKDYGSQRAEGQGYYIRDDQDYDSYDGYPNSPNGYHGRPGSDGGLGSVDRSYHRYDHGGRQYAQDDMGVIPSIVHRNRLHTTHDLGADRHLRYTTWGANYYDEGYEYDAPARNGLRSPRQSPNRPPSPQRKYRSPIHQRTHAGYSRVGPRTSGSGSQGSSLHHPRSNRAQQLREQHNLAKELALSTKFL